jgi:hypothetical protein
MKTEEEVPDTWNDVEKGKSSGGSEFFKIESGEQNKTTVRILSDVPYPHGSIYVKRGDKKSSLNVPFGSTIPGQEVKSNYALEVLVLDGPAAGSHKVLVAGQQLANQLKSIRTEWNGLKTCDVVIWKTGSFMTTKWLAVAKPSSKVNPESLLVPAFNLREKIKMATREELDALVPSGQSGAITKDQVNMIADLATAKDVTSDWVNKRIETKFGKKELDDLTSSEAQSLIDLLKAL